MTAEVVYLGDLRTEATRIASKNAFITDAPIDNQGKGMAFSPTDTVCAALGSCMMTIMAIYAESRNLQLVGSRIAVTKTMTANPRRIIRIDLEAAMSSSGISEQDQKHMERIGATCPVALSLHPDIQQVLTFKWT